LCFDPPERALVLSVDEKSQIRALDRTQPGLPMKKGRRGTMTHDYKRNGTRGRDIAGSREQILHTNMARFADLVSAGGQAG